MAEFIKIDEHTPEELTALVTGSDMFVDIETRLRAREVYEAAEIDEETGPLYYEVSTEYYDCPTIVIGDGTPDWRDVLLIETYDQMHEIGEQIASLAENLSDAGERIDIENGYVEIKKHKDGFYRLYFDYLHPDYRNEHEHIEYICTRAGLREIGCALSKLSSDDVTYVIAHGVAGVDNFVY